jgi:Fe-S-cluster containining protein
MKISLTEIRCEGCGACCRRVGTPPGFFLAEAFAMPHRDGEHFADDRDWEYWRAIPNEVRQELIDYYRGLFAGQIEDREAAEVASLWLDEQTGRCRHYEFRPMVCREALDPGDKACLTCRAHAGLSS